LFLQKWKWPTEENRLLTSVCEKRGRMVGNAAGKIEASFESSE